MVFLSYLYRPELMLFIESHIKSIEFSNESVENVLLAMGFTTIWAIFSTISKYIFNLAKNEDFLQSSFKNFSLILEELKEKLKKPIKLREKLVEKFFANLEVNRLKQTMGGEVNDQFKPPRAYMMEQSGQPTGGQPTGGQPTGGQPTGGQPGPLAAPIWVDRRPRLLLGNGVDLHGRRSHGSLVAIQGHDNPVPTQDNLSLSRFDFAQHSVAQDEIGKRLDELDKHIFPVHASLHERNNHSNMHKWFKWAYCHKVTTLNKETLITNTHLSLQERNFKGQEYDREIRRYENNMDNLVDRMDPHYYTYQIRIVEDRIRRVKSDNIPYPVRVDTD